MNIIEDILDTAGASRAAATDAALAAVGIGDGAQDARQLYAHGTRLYAEGVAKEEERRAEWLSRPLAHVALAEVAETVVAERRQDYHPALGSLLVTARGGLVQAGRDAHGNVSVGGDGDGSVHFGRLTPDGARDLIGALGIGGSAYLQSLRGKDADGERLFAANLNHALARSLASGVGAAVKVRSRRGMGGHGTVAAITGRDYQPLDLDAVATHLREALIRGHGPGIGGECRAEVTYDGGNGWTIDASWDSPVEPSARTVGEAHRIGVRVTGHDGGEAAVKVCMYAERIRCRNATVYEMTGLASRLVHRGNGWKLARAFRTAVDESVAGAVRVVNAWGSALESGVGERSGLGDLVADMLARADVVSVARGERLARQAALEGVLAAYEDETSPDRRAGWDAGSVSRAGLVAALTLWSQSQASEARARAEAYGGKLVMGGTVSSRDASGWVGA